MVFQQEEVLFRNGYDIGIGVAMATGSPMALGATGAVTPPEVGTGGSGSFTFRRIETTGELETELGIGADVSAGIGLFRASASFDFSKRCKIQSSSLTVMVSAEERFVFKQMDSPELSQAAKGLVDRPDLFAGKFGDYFVRGINSGGRFLGVVRIDTRSAQSKTDVNAALSGSYGLTVDAAVRLKITETMRSANATAEAFIIFDGGTVTTRPTSSDPIELLNQLFRAMDEWTSSVRKDPKAYSVTLAPYIIALGPNPPNVADIEHQRDVLIRCAKLRSQTLDKLNLIDYMLDPDHAAEFQIAPPPDGPDLPALQAALAGDLDVIADAASFSINNIKEACDPEVFMRKIQKVEGFKLTALPPNLPRHTGPLAPPAPQVQVPDCTRPGIRVPGIAHARLTQLGLKFKDSGPTELTVDGKLFKGHVTGQNPPGGALVDVGSEIFLQIGDFTSGPILLHPS
jgi:hypothetical protein